jgi:diphosphomevalonate decarboxylase
MSNSTESKNPSIKVGWESPSNIALVKYWGKYGNQLPQNPSVSFTLSTAATRTFVTWTRKPVNDQREVTFLLDGIENPAFKDRIEGFLAKLATDYFPFISDGHITIETSNSFPHSSGIASSASAMSALALCLCDIDYVLLGQTTFNDAFYRKASIISRLGSGSACRSIYPLMAVWGVEPSLPESSDQWATGISSVIHPIFHTFHDDILIINPDEKSVSSTAGHRLMENNPYAQVRYKQANERLSALIQALIDGNLDTFGKIVEDEALTLHALMMCSDPAYLLMDTGTLAVIKKIQNYRKVTGTPIWFTLDAGPNVHVLYPNEVEAQVANFIINELKPLCHEGKIIRDNTGTGPKKIL